RIQKNEGFYRAVFLVMLRSVDVPVYAEVHTHKGRCDCSIELSHAVYIFECKVARDHAEIARKREEGRKQIEEKGYAEPYANDTRSLVCASIVIDAKEHRAYL
ncbi:MAG: PD-(D/E)XK nuclease domain-containing protein, partial [Desulfovibrio sp.]|nr:PD-(D/E)XK nuclease domain-containing protein [Desulfovibrio sp.]